MSEFLRAVLIFGVVSLFMFIGGIDESLVKEVPLPGFTMYNEFKPSDIAHFQKFFDVFTDRKIFSKRQV